MGVSLTNGLFTDPHTSDTMVNPRELHRRASLLAGFALPILLIVAGCGVTDVPDNAAPLEEAAFAVISDTVSLQSPTAASSGSPAYVSFLPGTFPSGTTVLIRNERTTVQREATLVAGGLDPVPVTAQVGDRLLFTVATTSGGPTTYASVVPARRRPRVVRFNPPRGRTDVAISAAVVIVFSEPVDAATVTGATVSLKSEGGVTVAGEVRVSADGLSATFVPAVSLTANTLYRLELTEDVRDLDGSPIEAPRETSFRTRGVPSGTGESTPQPLPPALTRNAIAFRNFFGGIMLMASYGGGSLSIPGTTADDGEPAWSPDGARIVLARSARFTEPGLFILELAGSGRAIPTGQRGDEPAWSPDGTKIAFSSRRTGNSEIYVMNADGSDAIRLTDDAANDISPAWSPDGRRIAFVRTPDRTSQGTLLVMNADGSGAAPLQQDGASPAWSPDGRRIAFAKLITDPWRMDIYVMNADGTGVEQLTRNPTNAMSYGPTWSPDGARIAFAHSADADMFPYQIYVMNADGTGIEYLGPDAQGNLVSASYAPAWSPR